MADTKITALAAITTVDPAADVLPIVDVSDTSMAASGTTKKITSNQILGAGGTATLASATITGDLTVDTSTLKVDSANNRVGINQASPSHPFQIGTNDFIVNSVGNASIGDTAFAGTRLTLRESASQPNALAMTNRNATQTWRIGVDVSAVDDKILGFYDSTSTTFRMQLTDTGNLGLGVTPSAWGGISAKVFEFGNSGSNNSLWGNGANDLHLVSNAYFNGSNWVYNKTAASTRYNQLTGSHAWYTAPSGTAGNAITFTQAMTLDASGRLLVGTASAPSGGAVQSVLSNSTGAGIQLHNATGVNGGMISSVGGSGLIFYGYTGAVGSETYTERARIDTAGNLILQSSTTPATLTVNGQLTVNATSNTNLRFSYRGSDGVTRVANITLA